MRACLSPLVTVGGRALWHAFGALLDGRFPFDVCCSPGIGRRRFGRLAIFWGRFAVWKILGNSVGSQACRMATWGLDAPVLVCTSLVD